MSNDQDTIPDPADSVPDEVDGSGRFAVYDKTELRFRGGVHETKSAADEHRKTLAEGGPRGRFEVREV